MLFFPYSTEVHDGKIRLAALEIIAICFVVHLFVSSNSAQVKRQVTDLVNGYRTQVAQSTDTVPAPSEESESPLLGDSAVIPGLSLEGIAKKHAPPVQTLCAQELTRVFRAKLDTVQRASLINRLGFVPAHASPVGMITSLFVHSGWLHLIFNMLFFYVCGVAMEKYWGFWRFWAVYLASGVAACLAYMGTALASGQGEVPLVGASGAIAGAMGAFLVTHLRTKIKIFYFVGFRVGFFRVAAWIYLGIWFVVQIFWAMIDARAGGGIAYSAHIGGFAFGALLGWLVRSEDDASLVGAPATARTGGARQTGAFVSWSEPTAAGPPPPAGPPRHASGSFVTRPEGPAPRATRALPPQGLSAAVAAQVAQVQAQMAAAPPAASSIDKGWQAFQEVDYAGAVSHLTRGLNHCFQAPDQRRSEIAQTIDGIINAGERLRFPPAQLYAWAKSLIGLDLVQQAASCFDLAAATADTPHLQKNSLIAAAGVRLHSGFETEQARAGLQRVVELDGGGLFAKQAGEMLRQMGGRT
jgi:membrane associated rhomboid family serine protease